MNEEDDTVCPRPRVDRLLGRSYQNWMLRLPVRLGGMGLRSIAETSLAAFIGGVEQSVPHFMGENGLCKQLEPVLGHMDQSASRWEKMFSESRTGQEFSAAWNTLRDEYQQSCQYLDKPVEGLLANEAKGAGQGNEDGSTRRKTTILLEDTRAEVLVRSLEQYPDQTARPVWVHPQLDKLSQGWILALPGFKGFSQAEFTETVARYLCLPSPSCQTRVGVSLGQHGLKLDAYGDNIMSVSNIPGDTFRPRHETIKTVLNSFCTTSSIHAECEVYSLFKYLNLEKALDEESSLKLVKGRQGLLPDFKLMVPNQPGR